MKTTFDRVLRFNIDDIPGESCVCGSDYACDCPDIRQEIVDHYRIGWSYLDDENVAGDSYAWGHTADVERFAADIEAGTVWSPPVETPPRYEGPKTQVQSLNAHLREHFERTMLYGQDGIGLADNHAELWAMLNNTKTYPGIQASAYAPYRGATANFVILDEAPSCECGAAKCGSAIHSNWCPAHG